MTTVDKVALVSGANKGIGFEIAKGLARAGVRVYVGARDEQRGRDAERSLREDGLDATWIALDVTDRASIERARETIERRSERLDILVNNAGIATRASEDPADIYTTNVFGLAEMTRAFAPLLARTRGRVINLSSSLGSMTRLSDREHPASQAAPGFWQYASSKAAVNALTVLFARMLEPQGVSVNAVCPGHCATDLNGHTGPRSAEQGAQIAVKVALLPDPGTGRNLEDAGVVPW
ncbi:MAG TPA: SDR family oxidoreductase [Polyangiales bacterium]|nr:SDR family oxidoreductase [Polyangiales bacterium]